MGGEVGRLFNGYLGSRCTGEGFFGARTFSLEIEPADKGSSWEDDPVHTTSTGHSRWGISSRQHCSSVAAVRVTLFVQSRVTRNGGPSHIMTLMTTHDDCPSLSILRISDRNDIFFLGPCSFKEQPTFWCLVDFLFFISPAWIWQSSCPLAVFFSFYFSAEQSSWRMGRQLWRHHCVAEPSFCVVSTSLNCLPRDDWPTFPGTGWPIAWRVTNSLVFWCRLGRLATNARCNQLVHKCTHNLQYQESFLVLFNPWTIPHTWRCCDPSSGNIEYSQFPNRRAKRPKPDGHTF